MDLGIEGRVAVVTASSKGLGRASATALAAEGASVVVTGRDRDALERAAHDIGASGAEVLAVAGDVAAPGTPAAVIDAALARFGRLDIVVANAGGPPLGGALDVDDDAIESAVQANLLASVRLTRAALPHLRRQGWGRVCLITSYTVFHPAPRLALSNLARTGLWAWARTAAADLAALDRGVTLNMVCPGPHATERMTQLGGGDPAAMGDPSDFGKVVAFVCSAPAAYMNGAAVVVDGGTAI